MIYRAIGNVAYLYFHSADEILKILTRFRNAYCKNAVLQVATLPVPLVSLVVEYALTTFPPAWFPPAAPAVDLKKVNVETAEDVGNTLVIESGTVKGDINVETAEDVGNTLVIE